MKIKVMSGYNNRGVANNIKQKLIRNGFDTVEDGADIVLTVGGDGTFLKALRKNEYDTRPLYLGVNNGNLGYFTDISVDEIDYFIERLKEGSLGYIYDLPLAEVKFYMKNKKKYVIKDYAINELFIAGRSYGKINFKLSDGLQFSQKVSATGVNICTPSGSTGSNKSYGGPVFCQGVKALCTTFLAPIRNSKTEDFIDNSLLGNKFVITPLSYPDDVRMYIDGQRVNMYVCDIDRIVISIGADPIKKINVNATTYSQNLCDKMLKK